MQFKRLTQLPRGVRERKEAMPKMVRSQTGGRRESVCVCVEESDPMLRVMLCKLEARHERFVSVSVPWTQQCQWAGARGGEGAITVPPRYLVLAASGTSCRLAEADTGPWPVRVFP